jgi:hypothetical protein
VKLNPKKIAVLLVTGFFAFAPPGTLIFLALIAFGLFGKIGLIVIAAIGIIVSAFLIVKKKNKRASAGQSETGE